MLTKTELANQSGIPPSSLTYYLEQYGEYFEPQFMSGRRYPTYPEKSIELAQLIRQLISERLKPDEIRKILEEKDYTPIIDYVEKTNLEKLNLHNSDPIVEFSYSPSIEASLRAMEVLNRMNDNLRIVIEKQELEVEERDTIIEQLQAQITEQKKTIEELQSKTGSV